MVNSDLPPEIMFEIFSRLPTKSVHKCKCLSKTWKTDLSSASFLNLHLARNKTHRHLFISYVYIGCRDNIPWDFSIKSLKLSDLFSKEHHDDSDSLFQDVISSSEDYSSLYGFGMSVADDTLYVTARTNESEPAESVMYKYSLANSPKITQTGVVRMNSPKITPIIVAVKQRIYIINCPSMLVGGPGIVDPKAFEVYDPIEGVCKSLESPPCMTHMFFSPGPVSSYFVFDKYLYVSTDFMSCAFNTDTEKWERCELFSDFYHSGVFFSRMNRFGYECYLETLDNKLRKLFVGESPYGPPLPPMRTTLVYEGHLLCILISNNCDVLNFEIVNGKVVDYQVLLEEDVQEDYNEDGECLVGDHSLIDLGGGELCLVSRKENLVRFSKFKVEKSSEGRLTSAEADVKVSTVQMHESEEQSLLLLGTVGF